MRGRRIRYRSFGVCSFARGAHRHVECRPRWLAGGYGLVAVLSPEDVRARVDSAFDGIRGGLDELVRIPSVSIAESEADNVRRSAEVTAAWLERSKLDGVRLLEIDGAHPAVSGRPWAPRALRQFCSTPI